MFGLNKDCLIRIAIISSDDPIVLEDQAQQIITLGWRIYSKSEITIKDNTIYSIILFMDDRT